MLYDAHTKMHHDFVFLYSWHELLFVWYTITVIINMFLYSFCGYFKSMFQAFQVLSLTKEMLCVCMCGGGVVSFYFLSWIFPFLCLSNERQSIILILHNMTELNDYQNDINA